MPGDFSFAGFDRNARRAFLALVEKYADLAAVLPPADGAFVVFIGGDATTVTSDELRSAAEWLLNRGAVYFVIWGEGCERVEELVQDAIGARHRGAESPAIITSSHPDDSLGVALAFASTFAVPEQGLEAEILLVLIVEDPTRYAQASGVLHELLEDEPPVAAG